MDTAAITDLNDSDSNLILNIDFDQTSTDDIIDKTNYNQIQYNQDYEVSLDDDFRVTTDTFNIPDSIEKNNNEQAF